MSRKPAPVSPPVALTIATSDSGGGAGIQADLKTMEACGTFGTSVCCATTAQNTRGVESVHVLPIEEIAAQLDAVLSDFSIEGAKTGMLATADVVEFVADRARDFPFPLVVDPVMVATSGDRLLEPAGEAAYEEMLSAATLVTPNADETTVLTGIEIDGEAAAIEAGEALVEVGADAALVKGGHVPGDRVRDVLVTGDGPTTITHPRVATDATHGSGCTLASAITAHLARGADLDDAVTDGISLLARAVRYPLDVGDGPGSVHHLAALRERAARAETGEEVVEVAAALVARDARGLLPGSVTVAGATPYAERVAEITSIEVGESGTSVTHTQKSPTTARTLPSAHAGGRSDRGGESTLERAGRVLLAAREGAPELRFALGCRCTERVERVLSTLNRPVVAFEYDPADPTDANESEAATERVDAEMERAVRRAIETGANDEPSGDDGESESVSATTMVAIERGNDDDGGSTAWIVTPEAGGLVERGLELFDALEAEGRR